MITEEEFKEAAKIIGCDTAAIKAVQKVETGGRGGFDPDGKPKILFEGHVFWSQLKKAGIDPTTKTAGNENILYPKWTKQFYTKGGAAEYARLNKAKIINETAALASASYGMFQIMGFNYESCGCESVKEFVDRSSESEGAQLLLFCNFIKNNGLAKYLKAHDWANFAKRYNGPGYAENKYDIKLAQAYASYC